MSRSGAGSAFARAVLLGGVALWGGCAGGPAEAGLPNSQPDEASAAGQAPQLLDLLGRWVDPFGGGRPVVLFFADLDCPVTAGYAAEVDRLLVEYGALADFWVVYPGPDLRADDVREHVRQRGYRTKVARDPAQRWVELAGARVTPEAALFDGSGQLVYSGRIDDRWVDFDSARAEPTVRDLERVLLAVLAEELPDELAYAGAIRTDAVGCPLPATGP